MHFSSQRVISLVATLACLATGAGNVHAETNPIFKDAFTADPAPMIYKDTVYVYVGHDEGKDLKIQQAPADPPPIEAYNMTGWLCYSSKDMKTWTPHGTVLKPTDFKWAVADAWAAQVVEKNGKFYYYVTVQHDKTHNGKAIGVAVADSPTGPFVDARGSALVTDEMTHSPVGWWDDFDPTVWIDDDGTPWMAWGNANCYLVKLKTNMIELDGPIQKVPLPNYTEGPWLHKHGKTYYLIYAAFAHQEMIEKICYATAPRITGPWTYRGILTDAPPNSYTIHPGAIDFKGQGYFFYHNGNLVINGQKGSSGRRSVCLEYLYYHPDGTLQPVTQTVEGVNVPPHPAALGEPKKTMDTVVTDPGVKVTENSAPNATRWPDKPVFATTDNPWNSVRLAGMSFNHNGGAANLGQTFRVDADCRLKRISLYGGDGLGTDSNNPVTLALYDLGTPNDPAPSTYAAGANLFGNGKGLRIACQPQAPGLLHLDFAAENQVVLKAGHTYAFELQGIPNSAPLFWRQTQKDNYPKGAAYQNRALGENRNKSDFAMAVYADASRSTNK